MIKKGIVLLSLLICTLGFAKKPASSLRFHPYEIKNLEDRPAWWKVRVDEISDICSSVKKGKAEIVARTPLGYPVYALFYGDFSEKAPATNWSAGKASSSSGAYPGDVRHPQTIMVIAGVHGSEPESVAAAVNMISLLETGKDLRGKTDSLFCALAGNYRLIILPCVNMDGRSISPDHFRNQPYEIFRGCSQGWWKDGSLIGWKGSKEWFPLPLDKVSYPGGYPNSQGYNIQHDCAPGDTRTEEAKAIYRLAARWAVDLSVNCHSCQGYPFVKEPSRIDLERNIGTAMQLCSSCNDAFFSAGLLPKPRQTGKPHETINMTTVLPLCSGGVAITLECSHSCYDEKGRRCGYSFDEMMEPCFITLKTAMRMGLEKPFVPR